MVFARSERVQPPKVCRPNLQRHQRTTAGREPNQTGPSRVCWFPVVTTADSKTSNAVMDLTPDSCHRLSKNRKKARGSGSAPISDDRDLGYCGRAVGIAVPPMA